jgi:hypothetical protein
VVVVVVVVVMMMSTHITQTAGQWDCYKPMRVEACF